MAIILASQSAARRAMLDKAGVQYCAEPVYLDEETLREGLVSRGQSARNIADALAEAKALKLAVRKPADIIIGSDQILAAADGSLLSKAQNPQALLDQLLQLNGQRFALYSAVCVAQSAQIVWRHVERAQLTMAKLSDSYIGDYVDHYWPDIRHCVGGFRIEAEGARLFRRVEGDNFTIMGMPLLPLLAFLRQRGWAEQ